MTDEQRMVHLLVGRDVVRTGADSGARPARAAEIEAREDSNRRMLRARDAMDRSYAQPLDVPTLAAIAFVLDQDQALDFYVGKLGFEVDTDQDLGFMRWLTIRLPGDPDRMVLLEVPGAPAMSDETAAQVRDLLTKGAAGGHLFLTTDDAHRTHTDLKARGVEVVEEPVDRGYGIDFGLRDPFGNPVRVAQMRS